MGTTFNRLVRHKDMQLEQQTMTTCSSKWNQPYATLMQLRQHVSGKACACHTACQQASLSVSTMTACFQQKPCMLEATKAGVTEVLFDVSGFMFVRFTVSAVRSEESLLFQASLRNGA